MTRHTGGLAWGATSTRSRPEACARWRASWIETIPTWAPSAPTNRTWGARMRSLMRGSTDTELTSGEGTGGGSPAVVVDGHADRSIGPVPAGCRYPNVKGAPEGAPWLVGGFSYWTGRTLAACSPFGPSTMSNSTS